MVLTDLKHSYILSLKQDNHTTKAIMIAKMADNKTNSSFSHQSKIYTHEGEYFCKKDIAFVKGLTYVSSHYVVSMTCLEMTENAVRSIKLLNKLTQHCKSLIVQ